jgi:GlcNAc-P-P-Und epimerase
MRVLLTGGSGFIGTNYIDHLLEICKAEFVNLDIQPPRNKSHQRFWKECNLLNASRLTQEIKDFSPTHVVHLAAKCGVNEKRVSDFATNMEGTENLLRVLRAVPTVERVIFTSSLLVCRVGYVPKHDTDYQPSTLYGESKVRMEQIVRAQKDLPFAWTMIRPTSIWGPWCDEPYRSFFKAIAQEWYFHIGSGHYRRSIGYVGNTVYQIHQLLLAPIEKVNRRTMYLADGVVDLYDFSCEVQRTLNVKRIRNVPLSLIKLAAIGGDILSRMGWHNVSMTNFRLNNILTEYIYDFEPIMEVASPLPYDQKTGVEQTIQWMRTERIL